MGEIDCREGILASVERDYYSDFDEAVRSTVNVFLPALRDLVATNRFKVSYWWWCTVCQCMCPLARFACYISCYMTVDTCFYERTLTFAVTFSFRFTCTRSRQCWT